MKVDDVLMVVIGILSLIIFYKIINGSLIEGAEDVDSGVCSIEDFEKNFEQNYSKNDRSVINCTGESIRYVNDYCKGKPPEDMVKYIIDYCREESPPPPGCEGNYIPITNDNFFQMVRDDKYISKIKCFDVSQVTNMSPPNLSMEQVGVFDKVFNQDISSWDVHSVTDMSGMFFGCENFNQDLSSWHVDSVTNMYAMFLDCTAFNGPLNGWNVSQVQNMSGMFWNCSAFNQDLKDWDVSQVTDMSYMFYGCEKFNQDLSIWGHHLQGVNVKNMIGMFKGCPNTLNIKKAVDRWINYYNIPLFQGNADIYNYLGIQGY